MFGQSPESPEDAAHASEEKEQQHQHEVKTTGSTWRDRIDALYKSSAQGLRVAVYGCKVRLRSALESCHLEGRHEAVARLVLEVSAGWVSPSSRGLRGGDALLLSTGAAGSRNPRG